MEITLILSPENTIKLFELLHEIEIKRDDELIEDVEVEQNEAGVQQLYSVKLFIDAFSEYWLIAAALLEVAKSNNFAKLEEFLETDENDDLDENG